VRRPCCAVQVTLAVNKCESPQKADIQAAEFWELGLVPIPVSAISGSGEQKAPSVGTGSHNLSTWEALVKRRWFFWCAGTAELMDDLVANLPKVSVDDEVEVDREPLAVAIIGRPNVGKSSLLNALSGGLSICT
jgi:predicted GTPase